MSTEVASPSADTSISTAPKLFTRLHISPLNASLLPKLLGPSLAQVASSISFHELPVFPEKSYGYLTLPTPAAEALRKKLNGTTLRGVKMAVEEARPERKRKHAGGHEAQDDIAATKAKKREKKRTKLESDVLPAVELADGRHVKRGWVDSAKLKGKDAKKTRKDKTAKGEMLFRTSIPADRSMKNGAKIEKVKSASGERSKKRVELKEFENTDKFPTFLRDTVVKGAKPTSDFVEGQGWVDETGEVVEPGPKKRQARVASETPKSGNRKEDKKSTTHTDDVVEEDSDVSSAVSSSSDSSASEEESEDDRKDDEEAISPKLPLLTSTEVNTSFGASPLHAETDPSLPSHTPTPAKEVHPLEALFKKPAAPENVDSSSSRARPAPIKTSFSFGLEEDEDTTLASEPNYLHVPQTPFTRQDLRERGVRSAAPTPDTAAIGKKFSWRGTITDADEEEHATVSSEVDAEDVEDSIAGSAAGPSDGATKEQSDAERLFYERRGDFNRAIKARKREARKAVRQAENRKVGIGK